MSPPGLLSNGCDNSVSTMHSPTQVKTARLSCDYQVQTGHSGDEEEHLPKPKPQRYPPWLVNDLRSDHAGETGAVWIYNGILSVSRDRDLIGFATRHQMTEKSHLVALRSVLPPEDRTVLLPVWRVAGWLTGAFPSLFGAKAVHATIDAVETFVDEHYQKQIDKLRENNLYPDLLELLEKCQLDEVEHRDEARELAGEKLGRIVTLWCKLVQSGSRGAVALSRRI